MAANGTLSGAINQALTRALPIKTVSRIRTTRRGLDMLLPKGDLEPFRSSPLDHDRPPGLIALAKPKAIRPTLGRMTNG